MYIFTPNTLIESAKINANFDELGARLNILETPTVRYVLPSNFNSTTSIAYQDTGLKVTLPSAGTWRITCDLRISNASALNDYCTVRLYNQTQSVAITDSERLSLYPTASLQGTMPLNDEVVTSSANEIIRVELKPVNAKVYIMVSDSTAKTVMLANRLR